MHKTQTSPLLEVRRLSAWYGGAHILFELDFDINQGEVVSLMGRNGAGKSTTFLALMGLLQKKSGSIHFMGKDISHAEPYQIAQLGVGFVPEDRRIFTDLTVMENLSVGRQPPRQWPDGTEVATWTPERLFALFPNLGEMPHRSAARMSGGEQQMLSVARTLMGNPYLVLLDEPSEGIAPIIVDEMVEMILQLKAQGVSILLSEQNMHFAERVSDRAYVLEKGHIRFSGSMQALSVDKDARTALLSV